MDLNESSSYITEDGSLDYSVDWDSFNFESNLKGRKNIHEEYSQEVLKLYKAIPDVTDDEGMTQVKSIKNDYSELIIVNEDTMLKYSSLMMKYRNIVKENANLNLKYQSPVKAIKDCEKEEAELLKDYKLYKAAMQKGIETYTENFGLDIKARNLSDSTYEASLQFSEKKDSPHITFTVDRTKRKVIDFDASDALTLSEIDYINKTFGNFENLPRLLCALREIILS
ncbi:hypothetical protein NQ317_015860 [Molorchus minor]|uniref:Uncharacterized protein n=1 Tax=Molorchus minor TaxID=1323400 RepID=A0ABQ9IYP4_9CUCU|nr:hypothetical protein NQ317_015860 [Molorchus minor]